MKHMQDNTGKTRHSKLQVPSGTGSSSWAGVVWNSRNEKRGFHSAYIREDDEQD